MKITVFCVSLIFSIVISIQAQQQEKYSRIKIKLDLKEHSIIALAQLGVAIDHGQYQKDQYFIGEFSESEIKIIKNQGFQFDVLIADAAQFYIQRNTFESQTPPPSDNKCKPNEFENPKIQDPKHWRLGNFAGFFKYQEMLDILDSMALLYPHLISIKKPIDSFQSIEGRPIYWIRISNKPKVDQVDKPEMLYTAVHHAREPGGLSILIYYMWYLLENYNTDPAIQYLINNTELYFIPLVNPDGYLHDQTISPNGGGFWRKNRRLNVDGTRGVDLNRNYDYEFGYDNNGSSPNPSSEVYRGTHGFSEPETQAVKLFCEQHQFQFALNYHTYSNLLIYPWGYIPSLLTPDSDLFIETAKHMTEFNHYQYGTANQTVGYVVNGSSDDWMYGQQSSKNIIFAMSPEAGTSIDGFYPAKTRITPICNENVVPNLRCAQQLLGQIKLTSTQQDYIKTLSGYFHYRVAPLGIPSGNNYTVSIQPLDLNIQSIGNSKVYNQVGLTKERSDSISYLLNPKIKNGETLRYLLKINNGFYDFVDTISVQYFDANTNITIDQFNTNTLNDWTIPPGTWGNSKLIYYTPSASITDSPNGLYKNNAENIITLNKKIDLTKSFKAHISFYARWDLDQDFTVMQVAEEGTNHWVNMCGLYTHPGSVDQQLDEPLWDGSNLVWVKEKIDLNGFIGKKINIRFKLVSNAEFTADGFYFDDMLLETLDTFKVVSVSDIHFSNEMVIIPNPAQDDIRIQMNMESVEDLQYEIKNYLGSIVKPKSLFKLNESIDISALNKGVYIITLSNQNIKGSKIFIK